MSQTDPNPKPPAIDDGSSIPWYVTVAEIALVVIGLAGALTRALAHHADDPKNWPTLDLVTIAWVGVAAAGVILPSISEVGFGGIKLKINRLRRASKAYATSLDSLANLVQNWSTAAAMYVQVMGSDPVQLLESKEDTYAAYVRDRMGEAFEVFATTENGETVRVGLWLYDPISNKIKFAQGIDLQPESTEYAPGEGMIGRSFVENRGFNEEDVTKVPSYKPSRRVGVPLPYRAVLCVPVRWGGEAIGMITVDRSTVGFFDYIAVEVTKALGAQCALAVKTFEASGEG
jgi:GAF domain-containing protein